MADDYDPPTLTPSSTPEPFDPPTLAPRSIDDPPTLAPRGDISHVPLEDAETLGGGKKGKEAGSPPPSVAGYDILGELGRGGMGVVYKARQKGLKRVVALKMILAGAHAGSVEVARFRAEAEAVAKLQHPNIVQVYEVGEADGNPFFSLEYIDGGSLVDKLKGEPQPPRDAAQTIQILADAMHYAHEHGIVHRDLKPANVLMQKDDHRTVKDPSGASHPSFVMHSGCVYGVPKITDFGLAKPVEGDSGLTKSGAIVGTPSYMAPEQAASKDVGPAADVYALGAVLYDMLTGRPPFRASTPLDTILQVVSEEPVPPSRLQSKLPADLETICLKCLEKEIPKRYAAAADLAADLGRFLRGEPILARPIGAVGRIWKWAKRRPAVAGLIGVSCVAAVVLAGVIIFSNVQLGHERDYALDQKRIADEQRDAATRAKDEADKQRKRAQANFDKAREAVDSMLTRVGSSKLKNVPLLEELQKELLEEALKFNQQFLQEQSDDPEVRYATSKAYARAGGIRRMLGHHAEAAAAFREAAKLLQPLAEQFPDKQAYRGDLASSYHSISNALYNLHQYPEANKFSADAITQYERLRTEYPEEPEHRTGLAASLINESVLLSAVSKFREAEAPIRQAVAIMDALAKEFPNRPEYRLNLCVYLGNLGNWLANTESRERFLKAGETYKQAIVILDALVKEFPKDPAYREQLASTTTNLGTVHAQIQEIPEAEKHYKSTIAINRSLAGDFPKIPYYRIALANSHFNLGILLDMANRDAESEATYREGATLLEGVCTEFPKIPEHRQRWYGVLVNLAFVLDEQGKKAEAEKTIRQAVTVGKTVLADLPDSRYNHNQVGNALDQLGYWLMAKNDLVEARKVLEDALQHQTTALKILPGDHRYIRSANHHRLKLTEINLREKKYPEAAELVAQSVAAAPNHPQHLYNAACGMCMCIGALEKDKDLPAAKRQEFTTTWGDQAMNYLRTAFDKGFKDVNHMQKDPDLGPIRGRADFQEFLKAAAQAKPAPMPTKFDSKWLLFLGARW